MELRAGLQVRSRREAGRDLPVLVWRLEEPWRCCSTAPHGGGLGLRRWVINAQVPASYARRDPSAHAAKLGTSLGLAGSGVGMLTAADLRRRADHEDGGVEVVATVGLGHPILAAAPRIAEGGSSDAVVGTVNIVALVPERLSDAALVNLVATATEAKAQALWDLGLRATGTATDAVTVLCPPEGRPAAFGGPRSLWGGRLARAVHGAVLSGGRG